MNFLKRLWMYCLSKTSELKHMDYKDMMAAAVITEIQARKRSESSQLIPLDDLLYFHKIDRQNALDKLRLREKRLARQKKELLRQKKLTKEWMVEHFPSITHFKVVPYGDKFVVYDGNGRLMAMKNVIGSGVAVEVDVLNVPLDIEKKIRKIRKLNELE